MAKTKTSIKTFKSNLMASNMYFLMHEKSTIIIDPHVSEEALTYIDSNSLIVNYIILTHEHYDHISGVNLFRKMFGCKVICSYECAEAIQHPNLNFSKYFDVLMEIMPKEKEQGSLDIKPYSCFADISFEKKLELKWEGHEVLLKSTPGHSKGSICILVDNTYLFSGDSLLRDYPTVTCLKGGNSKTYKDRTLIFLNKLSQEVIVYPGHYESFILRDKN